MDTCAYVDTDLAIIIGKDVANGAVPVQGCMCKGAIPMFIQSGQLMDIAEIVGYDFVEERLEKHLFRRHDSAHCIYPKYAIANCTQHEPCAFDCVGGYTRSPDRKACICESPFSQCGRQCGFFPNGCPTTRPSKRQARPVSQPSARALPPSRPSSSLSKPSALPPRPSSSPAASSLGTIAAFSCPPGEQFCPTFGCIDTNTRLDSCGGCMDPLAQTFDNADNLSVRAAPGGVDCTVINGVSDVECRAGRCIVSSCLPGYKVSSTGNDCEPSRQNPSSLSGLTSSTGSPDNEASMLAVAGLEYSPDRIYPLSISPPDMAGGNNAIAGSAQTDNSNSGNPTQLLSTSGLGNSLAFADAEAHIGRLPGVGNGNTSPLDLTRFSADLIEGVAGQPPSIDLSAAASALDVTGDADDVNDVTPRIPTLPARLQFTNFRAHTFPIVPGSLANSDDLTSSAATGSDLVHELTIAEASPSGDSANLASLFTDTPNTSDQGLAIDRLRPAHLSAEPVSAIGALSVAPSILANAGSAVKDAHNRLLALNRLFASVGNGESEGSSEVPTDILETVANDFAQDSDGLGISAAMSSAATDAASLTGPAASSASPDSIQRLQRLANIFRGASNSALVATKDAEDAVQNVDGADQSSENIMDNIDGEGASTLESPSEGLDKLAITQLSTNPPSSNPPSLNAIDASGLVPQASVNEALSAVAESNPAGDSSANDYLTNAIASASSASSGVTSSGILSGEEVGDNGVSDESGPGTQPLNKLRLANAMAQHPSAAEAAPSSGSGCASSAGLPVGGGLSTPESSASSIIDNTENANKPAAPSADESSGGIQADDAMSNDAGAEMLAGSGIGVGTS